MSAIIYNAIILWNCFANLKQIAPKTVESTAKTAPLSSNRKITRQLSDPDTAQ
jgi:uncharacterized protein YjgD (DUF1641 family)